MAFRCARLVVLITGTLLTGTGQSACTQPPPEPDGRRLTLSTDTLVKFVIQGGDTIETGFIVDELRHITLDGRPALQRIYRSEDRQTVRSLDTLVDDASSLAPIMTASRSLRAIERVSYFPLRAHGVLHQPTGDSIAIDVALPALVYSSSSFDLVLRAAPLAEGWEAEVPSFVASSRVVVPMRARVHSVERIDDRECWRVEAEFMGMSVAFWVDTESRRLCQQVMRIRADLIVLYKRPTAAQRGRRAT